MNTLFIEGGTKGMQGQPDYTLYDQKGREAFLSQIGTFTPSEREAFHRLCRLWSPNLSYQSSLSILSAESPTAKSDLSAILKKLEKNQCGILRTVLQEGVRVPMHITLCNPGEAVFFQKLADEMLYDLLEDLARPLPSLASLKERGFELAPNAAQECDYPSLAKHAADTASTEDQLYLVQGPASVRYLVLKSNIKRYLTVCIGKFQAYFQNANFLAIIAQVKAMSLIDLRKNLTQKDPLFWLDLSACVLSSQKEILASRKVNADAQLVEVAYFIKNFLGEQILEQKKKKELELERATDMKTLAEKIHSSVALIVSEQDFAESILFYKPKYADDFQGFKDEFQKQYLEAPSGKNLPIVVRVGTAYIHMDNVSAYFMQNLHRIGKDMLAYYIRHMESYIKHPNSPGYEAFYSPANFDNHILDQVRSMSLIMHEMLERPNLVAEAMIHAVRKQKDIRNPLEMKQVLASFFHTDRIRFLSPSMVFGLSINDIFKIAFMKTGILRQLILKITGRYESFQRKFSGFMPEYDSVYDEDLSASLEPKRQHSEETKEKRRKRSDDANMSGPSLKKPNKTAAGITIPPPKPKPRVYSDNERNEAWDSFSKTIKK